MANEFTEKMDMLDLLINTLREHEKNLSEIAEKLDPRFERSKKVFNNLTKNGVLIALETIFKQRLPSGTLIDLKREAGWSDSWSITLWG